MEREDVVAAQPWKKVVGGFRLSGARVLGERKKKKLKLREEERVGY